MKKIYTSIPREQEPYGLCWGYSADADDPSPVFMFHEHDATMRGVELINAFNEPAWEQLRTNPQAKLLISYIGDYFNLSDLNKFKLALRVRAVPHERVWFVCMDKNFADHAERNMPGINAGVYNDLLRKVQEPDRHLDSQPERRFSVLSRNYRPWRFDFYLNLVKLGLLDKAVYSFHDFDPYNAAKPQYSIEEIGQDALRLGYDLNDPVIRNWIAKIPYDLPLSQRRDKWSPITTASIVSAGIHILLESHWFVFEHWADYKHSDPRQFVPGFITEKTYKAMACKRPFIAVTTPYFLEDVRRLGYQTFAPYIDESYDQIRNDHERMLAIVNEVERLNNLPDKEFLEVLKNLELVCEYNYLIFKEQQASNDWPNWPWLQELIK